MNNARLVSSKWLKQSILSRHEGVSVHIPETRIFSHGNTRTMLSRYGMVVMKPVVGSGGLGVLKVERSGSVWRCTSGADTVSYRSFNRLIRHINRLRRGRRYLIQRGIQLAKIEGRPIDFRVKTVKDADDWKITAMVGRLARPGLFVTNLCRGGTQLRFEEGVGRSIGFSKVPDKRETLRGVTRTCTQLLEQAFPGISRLGYDFGIDVNGHCWLLEVNTRPH